MLKKILAFVAMLYAAACFAAVDVNKATAAELDAIKGIGPTMSQRIIDERKKGNFKDWNDFITRVKGVGEATANKLSSDGLTVNGGTFKAAAAAKKDEKKEDKAAAKAEKKEEKAVAKSDKKEDKAMAKAEKKDDKPAAAATAAPAAKPAASAKK